MSEGELGVLPGRPAGRSAQRWERLGWLVLGGLLLGLTPLVLHRLHGGGCDFPHFWEAGRHILAHGRRAPDSLLYYYWPSVDVALVPLGLLPYGLAAALWYAANLAAFAGTLHLIGSGLLAAEEPAVRRQVVVATGLISLPLFLENACLGSFHVLVTCLLLAGLVQCARGRDLSGGALIGVAAWLKLLPLLAAAYLLLKRRWLAAATVVVVALTINVTLSVAGLGLRGAAEGNRGWLRYASGVGADLLRKPTYVPEQRESNQSLAGFLRRTLTTFGDESPLVVRRYAVAALSGGAVTAVHLLLIGALAATLGYALRRPAAQLGPADWQREIPVVLLCCLWFSPVAWGYHYVIAAPALAVALAHAYGRRRRSVAVTALALAALGLSCIRWVCGLSSYFWFSLLLGAYVLRGRPAEPPLE